MIWNPGKKTESINIEHFHNIIYHLGFATIDILV